MNFGKSLETLGPHEIRHYQLHLIKERHASWSLVRQTVAALRFLYGVTLQKKWVVEELPQKCLSLERVQVVG
jgi:hypothetical protein